MLQEAVENSIHYGYNTNPDIPVHRLIYQEMRMQYTYNYNNSATRS